MPDDEITVWRLIAHPDAQPEAATWFLESNLIAIGWGRIGNIVEKGYKSARDISDAIQDEYLSSANSGNGGICLYNLVYEMQIGDLVIVSVNSRRAVVMSVEGEYEFAPEPLPDPIGTFQHQRHAVMVDVEPEALWLSAGARPKVGHSIRWTLVECERKVLPSELKPLPDESAEQTAP